MSIRPMLGDVVLEKVQEVEGEERQAVTRHAVPGLEGDFLQRLGRRGALPMQLVDAPARQEPAAHEHLAKGLVWPRSGWRRQHHRTGIEDQLDAFAAVRELEHAGLALLTDELEDLGDSEVLDVSAQRHRHG